MVPRMVVAVATLLALLAPNAYAAPEGGFIVSSGTHYRIIGGAALEVGDCAPLGGCPGATVESPESYRKAPVDGTYIGVPNGSRPGLIARFAGGHAFWLMDCGALESGNCTPRYELDAAGYEAYEAAHPDVADGTFVRKASGSGAGTIARAAGGALIWLRDCAPMANCPGYVNVDAFAFENYGNAHPTIADGTYVRRPDGLIARAVGTALVGIGSCTQLAGCPGWIQLDDHGFNSYASSHTVIGNGAFVRVMTASGSALFARAAGGRLLFLTDCGVLGGCPGAVAIDESASTSYQNAHPLVADGTVLRGQPSGRVYKIVAGVRTSIGDPTGAIDVNDATVAQFLDGDPPRDADGDGVNPPLDCDDARADIRPGARDTPGDGVDQDCSGADAAYPKLDLLVGAFFNTRGSRTNLTSFYVRSVPAGTKLTLRCSGRGCRFKSTSVTLKKGKSRFSLLSRMKKAKLRTGARLELQLTHPAMVGKVIRWTIRTSKAPKRSNLCLPPGTTKAKSCSAAQ